MGLKLYVWEDVLEDYSPGIVCILAKNEEEAWNLLKYKDNTAWELLHNGTNYDRDNGMTKPREITKPEAFVVWGGG